MNTLTLQARVRRSSDAEGPWPIEVHPIIWRPAKTAAINCDMWDPHELDCKSAARRVAEMAPHMNTVVRGLRKRGAFIIHAPSGCMDLYRHAPGRHRAKSAPYAEAPMAFDWRDWDAAREAPLPMAMTDSEPCSCDSHEPCCTAMPPLAWSRQIASIEIAEEDAISDDGQEVFNLLNDRAIDLVVLMGVHANRCVLGRPFGIRQLAYLGLRPVLCRDLTDSYHREAGGHFAGNARIIEHIERYWCPTVTSDQLVGGRPFVFVALRQAI